MPRPPSRTAAIARLAEAPFPPLDDSVRPWPGRYVDVAGVHLHVRDTAAAAPDAEPMLFVHGLGGSAHNWTELAALLRTRFDMQSVDLPGHGFSGPPPRQDYSPAANARLVIAYLEQSATAPVHLVGNSMGGAISILVAAWRPDLVRTLTLISPAVPDNRIRMYPLRNDPRMAVMAVPVLGEALLRRVNARSAPEVRVAGTIALCFADKSRYPEARMREAVQEARERMSSPWAESAFLRSMRALGTSQFLRGRRGWSELRNISVPTLVLWGDADRLVAPDLAPYVAAAIPGSRLLVLEDIGHTAMMEDPRTTARAIVALVDDAATA